MSVSLGDLHRKFIASFRPVSLFTRDKGLVIQMSSDCVDTFDVVRITHVLRPVRL